MGAAALGAMSLVLAACGGSGDGGGDSTSGGTSDLSGSIAGAGATSQEAAMAGWIAGFTEANPGVSVSYDAVGSGGGREQFIAGAVAFAGSDAALDADEVSGATERCGSDVLELPIYISPIAVVYNLPDVDAEHVQLSAETIANIFNGTITNWNDAAIAAENPGVTFPDLAVVPVHRSDESGTTKNFTDYLAQASDGAWTDEASGDWPIQGGQSGQGTQGLIDVVAGAEGAIGYADASRAGDLGTVALQVGDAYVPVSAEAAATAVEASYDVRWLGVRIASARVTGAFEGQRYSLSIDSRYAVLISRGHITGRAEGELRGGRVLPTAYRLGASGEPEQRSAMTFEAGAARRISIEPPLAPDWNVGRVPLEPQHQRDVIDPLSALVLAAVRAGASRDDACRSTLPVFSGVSRFDVVLSPAEPRPLRRGERRDGPPPIACRIRFVPIAGHRPANVTVRELQRAPAMLVEFEPELTGNVRMPRRIEIPMRYGTVSVTRQTGTERVEQASD